MDNEALIVESIERVIADYGYAYVMTTHAATVYSTPEMVEPVFKPIVEPVEPFPLTISERPRRNVEPPQSLQPSKVPFRHRQKNPKVAGWLSTFVPGAGQIYNGQWWKVPIIYGGAYGMYYLYDFNKTERDLFQTELRTRMNLPIAQANLQNAILEEKPQTVIDSLSNIVSKLNSELNREVFWVERDGKWEELYSDRQILDGRNYYRRNLELVYVFSGLLYILNIVDASVFAHLATFDVSENLTMHVQPFASPDLSLYATQNQRMPMQGGLRLTFTLK
ncbi:MAG: DUF5683 domain-containing protein, partial [Bacteroidales bacterium]|jgi:hypothetical protein|nr:DUF5683 domain-containing protein [Bacteroidales bacterium]